MEFGVRLIADSSKLTAALERFLLSVTKKQFMKKLFITMVVVGTAIAGAILIMANKEEKRMDF